MEGQENTQSQPGLNLDTEILQKNENISTSLCDRFGIHMYTSEFMEQEKAYQEEQEEKNNEIFLNVLNNPEKEITETAFQRVMQADTTAVIKTEYNENNEMLDVLEVTDTDEFSDKLDVIYSYVISIKEEVAKLFEIANSYSKSFDIQANTIRKRIEVIKSGTSI